MAFSLTFENITSRNIKHIYSGTPARVKHRQSSDSPALAQLKREKEDEGVKREELRTAEYQSEYRCYVPKAPAFRSVSQQEAEEIVERLRRPTKAASWKSEGTDGNTRQEEENGDPKEKPSGEEVNAIVVRVQKPTKMSTIRSEGITGH